MPWRTLIAAGGALSVPIVVHADELLPGIVEGIALAIEAAKRAGIPADVIVELGLGTPVVLGTTGRGN